MKLSFIHSTYTEPHKIAYYEYGEPSNKAVILLHAFSHNGQFFHELAEYLSRQGLYVICPDTAGRGKSSYLANPRNYNYWLYVDDLFCLTTALKIDNITFMGNSMGGITSVLFAEKFPKLVNKIILNDIGFFIPAEESMRIGSFISQYMQHADFESAKQFVLKEMEQSGMNSEEITKITKYYTLEDGPGFTLNYDPNISEAFWIRTRQKRIPDLDFRDNYQNLSASNRNLEFYIIRGINSKLLDKEQFEEMKEYRNVKGCMEIEEKGHLPLFFNELETRQIANWILI